MADLVQLTAGIDAKVDSEAVVCTGWGGEGGDRPPWCPDGQKRRALKCPSAYQSRSTLKGDQHCFIPLKFSPWAGPPLAPGPPFGHACLKCTSGALPQPHQ